LSQITAFDAHIRDLRHRPLGKLSDRPALKPLVVGFGGNLAQRDVVTHARPDRMDRAERGVPHALAGRPPNVRRCGTGRQHVGRPGNLVVQLGCPPDPAAAISLQPIAQNGLPCAGGRHATGQTP